MNKDAISFLKDSFPGNFPTINMIPITEAEIKGIISSLKPKKLLSLLRNNKKSYIILYFIDQYPIKLYL